MDPPTPTRLKLQKTVGLSIDWSDGKSSTFTIVQLRAKCPCALCKDSREKQQKSRLTVLSSGGFDGPMIVTKAEQVGGYALKLTFADGHDTGIYSWQYLRELGELG